MFMATQRAQAIAPGAKENRPQRFACWVGFQVAYVGEGVRPSFSAQPFASPADTAAHADAPQAR